MTKKYSDSEKKDKKAALKEITEQLEKSIHEFMNGEKYKNFLNQMSKFHSYSLNNQSRTTSKSRGTRNQNHLPCTV